MLSLLSISTTGISNFQIKPGHSLFEVPLVVDGELSIGTDSAGVSFNSANHALLISDSANQASAKLLFST